MKLRLFCIFCAICLFIAILNLPIAYYTFLRITVTIGAVLVLIKGRNQILNFWFLSFTLIAVLYNPVFPVYLYEKSKWIPIDILTGILFLIVRFGKEEEPENKQKEENSPGAKSYQRDKIIHTTYKKNLKEK